MATESVATEKPSLPDEDTLSALRLHNWVCDHQTHRVLWEAQSICRMINERMDEKPVDADIEIELFGLQAVERLLCSVIERSGWSPAGNAP